MWARRACWLYLLLCVPAAIGIAIAVIGGIFEMIFG